ncbi:MAG: 1-deoxy-D-xylulose-5-phosphate synthase [Firmicutes bacterium]|jgi:1-deoxy-D-xylulose-5-phosphate synthase|nr:1-deoxy-D-xylulose-5-phosphate synthase [Bacillota bacterium]MDH7495081.1 1-deoxy-D-xylulose-5-phosphate synthase [Bacillota bacterium]
MRLLDSLDLPHDLKRLAPRELDRLAQEIREEIIHTVAKTGGHLASSLGAVDLAIALHAVLDSPRDKIIWDVGHQAYAHKIITGRRAAFGSLRQYGGLSGFPRRDESPHDAFNTGHSSTSVSAALGMAMARDLKGEDFTVVAVIGDGSLTGGMAFEALNHAGHVKTDLIVVLNDNEMSISPNVGALASYLARIRTEPRLLKLRQDIERVLEGVPRIGKDLAESLRRLKGSVKYLVVPGMLFESLGFTYLGPLDGHDISSVMRTIEDARAKGGPVLVHVVTKKGRGYAPAERDPRRFHGVGRFDVASGELPKQPGPPTFTQVFGETLASIAAEDDRIVAITAAMPDGTGLDVFARLHPDRFFDVGIAEQHAVTLAAGLASLGIVPVAAIYSTFLQRAYDQIVHDVALQGLHVVFAVDRAGLVGEDGPTHHGAFDLAYLRGVPGMTLMAPADEEELVAMVRAALSMDGPVAVRYPKSQGFGQAALRPPQPVERGKGVLVQDGDDVAIVAIGSMVHPSLQAARLLEREGVRAAVVNARFAKPLDEDLLIQVTESCRRIVVVEEGTPLGGFGSAVLETLARRGYGEQAVAVSHLALPDAFVQHGSREALLAACGLTPMHIARAAQDLCGADNSASRSWRGLHRSLQEQRRGSSSPDVGVAKWEAQTTLSRE